MEHPFFAAGLSLYPNHSIVFKEDKLSKADFLKRLAKSYININNLSTELSGVPDI